MSELTIKPELYEDRSIAIRLMEGEMVYDWLTTHIEDGSLASDEICIPSWNLRTDIAGDLLASGRFQETGRVASDGFSDAPVWRVICPELLTSISVLRAEGPAPRIVNTDRPVVVASSEAINTEKRAFNVHPGIIKHLIKEQAGTLVKAVAELVMNSVDAGATRIDLDFLNDGTFTISDDGRGFVDRAEIETFFETFGTPHADGDATFGRFRIGRGQIMAFANTRWRSGNFIMDVRLQDSDADFGYTLTETEDFHSGCQIEGQITNDDVVREARYQGLIDNKRYRGFEDENSISNMVRYVSVPVYSSGALLNSRPCDLKWSKEDELGYYLFDKSSDLRVFNQGIYVCSAGRDEFSVGGIFVSKKPIKLNMARNAWLRYECEVIANLRTVAHQEYRDAIQRTARLTEPEMGAIIRRIANELDEIDKDEAKALLFIKFIPTLSGERLSPFKFLDATQYSTYNGEESLVAERAAKEAGIAFLTRQFLDLGCLRFSNENAMQMLNHMIKLFKPYKYHPYGRTFVPFQDLVEAYSGTFKEVSDSELSARQLSALKAIRHVNYDLWRLTRDSTNTARSMVAGRSDSCDAWTDGMTYIAFNTQTLDDAYLTQNTGGIERLVNLAIHEFCHQAKSSVDTHEHSRQFYLLYHDATMRGEYAHIVRKCHRFYLRQLRKAELRISSLEKTHSSALGKIASERDGKFPAKTRKRFHV